jgi:hypothetical protein
VLASSDWLNRWSATAFDTSLDIGASVERSCVGSLVYAGGDFYNSGQSRMSLAALSQADGSAPHEP